MAEWEREEISSRVSASIPVRAKLGKPLGGAAAFGYSWKDKQFVVNETEAPIRKLIYEIFLKTLRKKTTADHLNRLGHRTRKGALFSSTTVVRLLKDTTAKGERIANYTKFSTDGKRAILKPASEWTRTKCPPIVSEKTWNKVNYILAEQERSNVRTGRRSEYLLSGLVKCSCSKKMYIKTSAKAYQCKYCNVKISVGDIEKIFFGYLSDCLKNMDFQRHIETSSIKLQKKKILLEEMAEEKALIVKKLDSYASMRMDGQMTKNEFIGKLYLLNSQLAQLEEFLDNLRHEMESEGRRLVFIKDYISHAKILAMEWHTIEFERKRNIIEAITKHLLITKTEINIDFFIDVQKFLPSGKILFDLPPGIPGCEFKRTFRKPLSDKYPEKPVTLGDHIRKKRMDDNLKQSEVAKIIGVSTDCITYWENNRNQPQISFYPKIHEFLNHFTIPYDTTTFSGRLRYYRVRNGFSCKVLAGLLKVDTSTIRAWEKGSNNPSEKLRKKLEELIK